MNIFEQGKELKAGFAKFEKPGDETQGTYVGKKSGIDGFNNTQTVYELMDEVGNIVLVGIKDTDKVFHDNMRHVHLGQIIGVKYMKDVPTGKGNPFKLLSIFHDPKIVNEEWLRANSVQTIEVPVERNRVFANQTSGDAPKNEGTPFDIFSVPTEPVPVSDEDKIKKIIELAGTKFGLTDANDIKNRVMEETKLAFIASNLDAIITALK